MDPGIPVPPRHYGGIERIVALLADEYVRLGHSVTLLAGPESATAANTITFGLNDLHRSSGQKARELAWMWIFLLRHAGEYDAVHSFGRLAYLLPILPTKTRKMMSYQRQVSPGGIRNVTRLPHRHIRFTGCSNYCVGTGNVGGGHWDTVYNTIDFSAYQLQDRIANDAPLMFLGRMDRVKGLKAAIDVALATGSTLWIGGTVPDTPDNLRYYRETIEPLLDGKQIVYLGALQDEQKNTYLGASRALLFPIEWDEPFGIVMIEAMACGTPVIAFNRGAVPEVVDEGVTGLRVNNVSEMQQALQFLPRIDRRACREHAQKRFDIRVIAPHYLHLLQHD